MQAAGYLDLNFGVAPQNILLLFTEPTISARKFSRLYSSEGISIILCVKIVLMGLRKNFKNLVLHIFPCITKRTRQTEPTPLNQIKLELQLAFLLPVSYNIPNQTNLRDELSGKIIISRTRRKRKLAKVFCASSQNDQRYLLVSKFKQTKAIGWNLCLRRIMKDEEPSSKTGQHDSQNGKTNERRD